MRTRYSRVAEINLSPSQLGKLGYKVTLSASGTYALINPRCQPALRFTENVDEILLTQECIAICLQSVICHQIQESLTDQRV